MAEIAMGHWDFSIFIAELKFPVIEINSSIKKMIIIFGQVWKNFDIKIIMRAIGSSDKKLERRVSGMLGALNASGFIQRSMVDSSKFCVTHPIKPPYIKLDEGQILKIKTQSRLFAQKNH